MLQEAAVGTVSTPVVHQLLDDLGLPEEVAEGLTALVGTAAGYAVGGVLRVARRRTTKCGTTG